MFFAMFTDAFQDSEEGVLIRYRTNEKLFNQRLLLAVTKVKETVIKDFLFADDCALNSTSEQAMQASTYRQDFWGKRQENQSLVPTLPWQAPPKTQHLSKR